MSGVTEILDQLFAKSSITLPQFGKEVVVKKVTLRTMRPVTDLIGKVMVDIAGEGQQINLQDPSLILKLISKHYDEVVGIIISLSSVTADELLDMDTDESVLLIQAVVALNRDFFIKKVLPNLHLLDASMGVEAKAE